LWAEIPDEVRDDEVITREVAEFIDRWNAKSVVALEQFIGCPHEEGIDYPDGEKKIRNTHFRKEGIGTPEDISNEEILPTANRMAEGAALLVDGVLPREPSRQWVPSVPSALDYLFATAPTVMGQVLGIVTQIIASYLIKAAGITRAPDLPTGDK
jgi:hypothetical protein